MSADDAVESRAVGGEAVREYSFKAPASAFPDARDLGDTDVDCACLGEPLGAVA